MYFVITAMLFFSSSDQVVYTEYDQATFDSVPTCQEYLFHNKVRLTKDIFKTHNLKDDMKGYEFFCESRYSTKKSKGSEV
jgi:hypothetical protein|tara:strand:- start:341 stop:580 length:240 start_codon:yes stop_codon:yes gene_type:complete